LIYFSSCKENSLILEAEGFPVLPCGAEASDTADEEVDGPEKEEELGIFQTLERLEEVTSKLTSR